MNILTFVLMMWLLVVAAAWCIDNGTQMLAEYRAEQKRKEAKKKVEEANLTLAIARHNHVRLALRKPATGAHRLDKVA
ncbi:hypothetical protein SEA_GIRLPOWER_64 [Streptomyces phage GirlPower]|nr:hypothetical protein SEA_GIRLPOWER_64 [Streptomyces phage GirlPower]